MNEKTNLTLVMFALFSGTAYAGPALEQAGSVDMQLQLPPPAACAVADTVRSAADRPALKTRTATFNSQFHLRVADGKVWMRAAAGNAAWEVLETPQEAGRIKEISADGNNFIAVSEENRVFYMKFASRKWKVKWGKPASKELYLPENRSWAISHLGEEVQGYEDPDGKFIPSVAGVSTLYLLSKDGSSILYTDSWLMPEFSYHINLPLKNRFVAQAMSASASTLFVIGKSGRMFTRLADFDTMGCDPLFKYSFESSPEPDVIRLPGEDWREQPRINGRITSGITIFQNGRGNAGRELRVAGVDRGGNGGYYYKPISGAVWRFVRTGEPVPGPFLGGPDELRPSLAADHPVSYGRVLPEGSVLKDFDPKNHKARIVVPGFENMPLIFHTRETMLPNRTGDPVKLFGTIELPSSLMNSGDPAAVKLVKKLGGEKFKEVYAKVVDGRVELKNNVLPSITPSLQAIFHHLVSVF